MSGRKYAVFTMDMEDLADTGCFRDWGIRAPSHMLDGLDEYINLLEKHGIRSTLFAMCDAAERVQERLRSYLKRGHSLALHGGDHTAPMTLTDEEFRRRTAEAKARLEAQFGVAVRGYRAPYFSLDNRRLEVLPELGFTYDSSRFDFPKRDYAGQIDVAGFKRLAKEVFCREGFYEFGMPTHRFMGLRIPLSGGGYTRMSEFTFFCSILTQYLTKNNYYVFYLHPFELSKEPMPFIPGLRKRDQYYLHVGTRSSFAFKIECIIKILKKLGYEFVTFEELAEKIEKHGEKTFA